MLVLSRQRDETIVIGDDIEITVVDIRGEKERLGINAPPHVAVHRKEVYDAIKREKQAAAVKNGTEGSVVHVDSLAQRKKNGDNSHPPRPNGAPSDAKPAV
jgi:carbon storage regulator CsrA